MAKAPGDPRSNETDDIVFDPNSYPNVHFVPTEQPPAPPNVLGGIPYRGQEQHGVKFDSVPAEYGTLAAEQAARDKYDSEVTPRDLETLKPVPVQIINAPDLIHELKSRQTSFTCQPGQTIQLAQYQQLRTRLRVTMSMVAGSQCEVIYGNDSQLNSMTGIQCRYGNFGNAVTLIETTSNDPLYFTVLGSNELVTVQVWTEYWHYDGEKLL